MNYRPYRGDFARLRTATARESVNAADVAWILLLPCVAVAVPAIALLAPIGGRLLLPDPHYSYWSGPGLRKPAIDVGYALFVLAVAAYSGAIVRCSGLRMAPAMRRALVAAAQAATVAVLGLVAQRQQRFFGATYAYFTTTTLIVAAVATVVFGVLVLSRRREPSSDA